MYSAFLSDVRVMCFIITFNSANAKSLCGIGQLTFIRELNRFQNYEQCNPSATVSNTARHLG